MTNSVQRATLAGGCFWCTEAIFRRLKGVTQVIPGYAGGSSPNPTYQEVSGGRTGHAEAVQITFDPSVLPYRKLLQIFFHLHDPTTKNQQGNDVGTQYRSVVFYHNTSQKEDAESLKREISAEGVYTGPIVTEIVPLTDFTPAEEAHRRYYEKNSYAPYCQYIIDPKLSKLLAEFASDVKPEYR